MIMALIDFDVTSENREQVLGTLRSLLDEARAFDGNRSYRAVTSCESPTHIGLLHEWENLEQFNAYAASDLFVRLGQVLRPFMITPPISRRLQTDILQELRG